MLELLMLIIKWGIQVGQNNNKAHNATETNNTDEAVRLIVLKQFRNLHTLALVTGQSLPRSRLIMVGNNLYNCQYTSCSVLDGNNITDKVTS